MLGQTLVDQLFQFAQLLIGYAGLLQGVLGLLEIGQAAAAGAFGLPPPAAVISIDALFETLLSVVLTGGHVCCTLTAASAAVQLLLQSAFEWLCSGLHTASLVIAFPFAPPDSQCFSISSNISFGAEGILDFLFLLAFSLSASVVISRAFFV